MKNSATFSESEPDWPLVLMPVHIVFLELIIDPACSIAFEAEAEEADLMTRPPRAAEAPVFGAGQIVFSLLQGLISLTGIVSVFGWSLYRGDSEELVRTLTFATLVLCMVGLIFVNRSRSQSFWSTLQLPNRAFWLVVGGALSFLGGVIYLPQARSIFRFAEPDWSDFIIFLLAGALVAVCLESTKILRNVFGVDSNFASRNPRKFTRAAP